MNSSALLSAVLGLVLVALVPFKSFAATTAVYSLKEFATESNINNPNLDESSVEKVNALIPGLQKRFCSLKIRPDAVAVVVGLVTVEWNIDRICTAKTHEDREEERH